MFDDQGFTAYGRSLMTGTPEMTTYGVQELTGTQGFSPYGVELTRGIETFGGNSLLQQQHTLLGQRQDLLNQNYFFDSDPWRR